MKKTVLGAMSAAALLGMIFVPIPSSNAATYGAYSGHDGSISVNLEKVTVEPYKGRPGLWVYIVKACAGVYPLSVAGVILKSDVEQQTMGVNKTIQKGECSHYGAVMKAKDGKTLGAELITKGDAAKKITDILNDKTMTSKQKTTAFKELLKLYTWLGITPKF